MNCILTQFRNAYFNYDCGMGYIIRCGDGRLVVIDGGIGEIEESDAFFDTMKSMSPSSKPTVALWIITHSHVDHFGVFTQLAERCPGDLEIEKIAFRFPDAETAWGMSDTSAFYSAVERLGDDKVVVPSSGDVFDIGGCRIDILFTLADLPAGTRCSVNDTSIAFMITHKSRRVLFIGDGAAVQSSVLCSKYGKSDLECDVFQIGHHGYCGGSEELHALISPSVLLWPAPDYRFPLLLPLPHEQMKRYCPDFVTEELLQRFWDINSSIAYLPSVRRIAYSGREQFTIDLTKFASLSDPWTGDSSSFMSPDPTGPDKDVIAFESFENFDAKRLYDLHWSFEYYKNFGPVKAEREKNGVRITTLTEKPSACQMIKDCDFGSFRSFRLTLKGTLHEGSISVQFFGEPPVLVKNVVPVSVGVSPGESFVLEISADEKTGTAVFSLNGELRTEEYDPGQMMGFYLFLKNASLSVTYLECRGAI